MYFGIKVLKENFLKIIVVQAEHYLSNRNKNPPANEGDRS
jgi:hypothetical protein